MEPQPNQGEPAPDDLQRAADNLQNALIEPLPNTPPAPLRSLTISDSSAMRELLETLVLRVDQVARTSAEQFSRVEQATEQMVKTMQLAQVMISEQDRQQQELGDLMDRQESATAALIKVNANLSEIVAALIGHQA